MTQEKQEFKVDFIGIGSAKSGTTWLAECLREHPQIFMPKWKELCFFYEQDGYGNYWRGSEWYKNAFKNKRNGQIIGEFTNHYMIGEKSAELISESFPDVKLIACLRNPVDMIYSFYWWYRSTFAGNKIPDTFEKAVEKDDEITRWGFYFKHLSRYFKTFPREQIKIVFHEDLKSNPEKVLNEIYNFLDVDIDFIPESLEKKVNTTRQARSKSVTNFVQAAYNFSKVLKINTFIRSIIRGTGINKLYEDLTTKEFKYPPMSTNTRDKLVRLYKDDINKLELLIDRDLSSWKE